MLGRATIMDVFENTFSHLYRYVYRRIEDREFIEEILKQIYINLFALNELDADKAKLVAYQLAYTLLNKRSLISTPEDFWSSLSSRETETLRLRFLEGLSTFEIAFVLQEQAGKLDAFLYATMMKLQDVFSPISKKQFVGAYFSDVNAYFKQLKEKEQIEIPQELKVELAKALFNKEYNTDRDFTLPEPQELIGKEKADKERSEVKDFFNKPMGDNEKQQFSSGKKETVNEAPEFIKKAAELEERHPEWALREEEQWVPQDKPSALPKDNPEGYGMDLLRTFSGPEPQGEANNTQFEEDGDHVQTDKVKEETNDFVADEESKNVSKEDFPDPLSVLESTALARARADQGREQADQGLDEQEQTFEYSVPAKELSPDDELKELQEKVGVFETLRKSALSPIIALLIVVLGTVFWPFKPDTDQFSEQYNIYYSEGIAFEERKDLVENVLNDLVADRNVKDVYVDRLTEKNIQVTFRLEEAEKEGEIFVFYKMDDGRWAPRKYHAVTK